MTMGNGIPNALGALAVFPSRRLCACMLVVGLLTLTVPAGLHADICRWDRARRFQAPRGLNRGRGCS